MPKLTLPDIGNFNSEGITRINSNNDLIEAALENTLSRDGTIPNQMSVDIDMNENDLLNVGIVDATSFSINGSTDFQALLDEAEASATTATTQAGIATTQADRAEAEADRAELAADAIPLAGTAGQVLSKIDGTDYNTEWRGVEEVPAGGTTGQVLSKVSGTNFDTEWSTPAIGAYNQFNVLDHGASELNTTAQNKTALQAAISACDAAGGGTILNPWPIDYGYDPDDPASYPSFTGIVNDMMVLDHGPASVGYATAGAKQGWMEKRWYHTPQTSPVGQHDGNGFRVGGDWHPYFWGDVNVPNVAVGSRSADYNYRVSYFTGLRGAAVWQWGQGVTNQGDLADVELLDFNLLGYGPAGVEYYPLIVDYTNGTAVYGLGTSAPQAAHHFHKPATTTGFAHTKYSVEDGTDLVIHWQKGITFTTTRDVVWNLDGTNLTLQFPDLGNALQIARNSRNITTGADLTVTGALSKGSGTFDIKHPDPAKSETHRLRHSFVESPNRGDNIYRFKVSVSGGSCVVTLPNYFKYLNEDPQAWVNQKKGFGRGYVEFSEDSFELFVDTPGEYDVLVIATRKDEAAKKGWDPLGLEYEAHENPDLLVDEINPI